MFECFHGMTHLLSFHNRCFNPAENVQRPEPYEVSDLMVKKKKMCKLLWAANCPSCELGVLTFSSLSSAL